MTSRVAGGVLVVAAASGVLPSACGGATVDSRPRPDAGADGSALETGGAGGGGRTGAGTGGGSGGRLAGGGADGSGGRVATGGAGGNGGPTGDASVDAEIADASVSDGPLPSDARPVDSSVSRDGAVRDAPGTDGALPSDAGTDPCLDPTGTACDGNTYRVCVNGEAVDIDCTTYFLDATPPVSNVCRRFSEGSRCTSRVGDPCITYREGLFFPFRCAGVDPGCVSLGSGMSECVEHLGPCDTTAPLHRCAGGVNLTFCQEGGQPLGYACAGFYLGSTCGSDGTASWCEGITAGGICDSNADGGVDGGRAESRCAPGLTCIKEPNKSVGTCG